MMTPVSFFNFCYTSIEGLPYSITLLFICVRGKKIDFVYTITSWCGPSLNSSDLATVFLILWLLNSVAIINSTKRKEKGLCQKWNKKKGPTRIYFKIYNILQVRKHLPHRLMVTHSPTKYELFSLSYTLQSICFPQSTQHCYCQANLFTIVIRWRGNKLSISHSLEA